MGVSAKSAVAVMSAVNAMNDEARMTNDEGMNK
jgi:hypothetical protein